MSGLAFTGDMAQLQQAVAESQDIVVRRGIVLAALNLRTGERVLELGCGGGYLAREVAQYVGQEGRVCAIDISPDQIAAAQARCADLSWVECRTGDITAPPYADSEFDAIVAVQALEYLADLDGALHYIHRMPHSGERLVVVATDWSSAVWHSEDAAGADRMGAARTALGSVLYSGGAASSGMHPAFAADANPDPEHVL